MSQLLTARIYLHMLNASAINTFIKKGCLTTNINSNMFNNITKSFSIFLKSLDVIMKS